MMTFKTYSELVERLTFEDRFRYLALGGTVGDRTFGDERYLNQTFYNTAAWKRARDIVIIRDNNCDLGVEGHDIYGVVYIHHLNPVTPDDLKFGRPSLVDPENLISVTHKTHNAIHYGDESHLSQPLVERRPGDHIDW
jgi:hypothetical protein